MSLLRGFPLICIAMLMSSCQLPSSLMPGDDAVVTPNTNASPGPQISLLATNVQTVGWGMAVDSQGSVYTTTAKGVIKITQSGDESILVAGVHGTGGVEGYPNGLAPATLLAVDPSDNVYAVSWYGGDALKISPNGEVSVIGSIEPGTLGLTADSVGSIYYTLYPGNTQMPHGTVVKRMTPSGEVSVYASGFNDPQGLASDSNGNIYVVDAGNQVVKQIAPDGSVSVIAGTGTTGASNSTDMQSTFDFSPFGGQPTAIAMSPIGNLYVGQAYGVGLMRMINSNGDVSNFCGNGTDNSGVAPGPCSESPLYLNSMAIGLDGAIYFNDGYGDIGVVTNFMFGAP